MKSHDNSRRLAFLFVALFLAASTAIDVRTKMWNDELYTYYVGAQPGFKAVYEAVAHGRDVIPPWYAMMVHFLLPFAGSEELAVRLPATLGFCAMILCVFAFCRRRMPAWFAFLAAAIACYSCLEYATDGRFYGMVLGCVGGALLAWQAAADGRRRGIAIPLLAICMGLMVAMHYYSVFFLVPLLVAETARARTSGRWDIPVLSALAAAPVVLALHYPLIAAARGITSSHYWSHADAGMILPFYVGSFGPALVLCSLALVFPAFFPATPTEERANAVNFRPHEWVFLAAIALLPPFVIIVSTYTTHVFVERYLAWVAAAFAILAVAVVCRATRGRRVVAMALLGVAMSAIGLKEVKALLAPRDLLAGQASLDELRQLPGSSAPGASQEQIMIVDTHIFMELSHYADPEFRNRIFLGVSHPLSIRFDGWDNDQKVLAMLSERAPIRVLDLNLALAKFPRLLLVATPEDYIVPYLLSMGYHVVPLRLEPENTIYSVEAPGKN